MLLPASGGRLVLASDGVWSQAGRELLQTMRDAPLKTAAHAVIKAVAGVSSRVDASVIVADVLPPGETFQELCKRQQAATAAAAAGGLPPPGHGVGPALRRLLGLRRTHSSPLPEQPQQLQQPGEAAKQAPAAAKLLMDVDTADLLGLLPPAGSSSARSLLGGGSSVSSNASSASSTSTWHRIAAAAGYDAAAALADAAAQPSPPQPLPVPVWFDEQLAEQMRAALVSTAGCCGRCRLLCCAGRLQALGCTANAVCCCLLPAPPAGGVSPAVAPGAPPPGRRGDCRPV